MNRPCVVNDCDQPSLIDGRCRSHWRQWRRQKNADPPVFTKGGLSASDVLRRVPGLSYRMLDYYCRVGAISPALKDTSGSGTYRLFRLHRRAGVPR